MLATGLSRRISWACGFSDDLHHVSCQMADTRPTPVSFWRAVKLCVMLIVSPQRFVDEEARDTVERKNYSERHEPPHGAHTVRAAFLSSLSLVLLSGAIGFAAARLIGATGRCFAAEHVAWLQIVGASLLLWGTLFIRGWEIQTYCGVSFTERVNQWLYRGLYCIGTSVIVYSLAFPACKQ